MTLNEEKELIRLYDMWAAETDLSKRNVMAKDTFAAHLKKSLKSKGKWKDKDRGKGTEEINEAVKLDNYLVSYIVENMDMDKDKARDYLMKLKGYKELSVIPFTIDKNNWTALMYACQEYKKNLKQR